MALGGRVYRHELTPALVISGWSSISHRTAYAVACLRQALSAYASGVTRP